ncbi:cytochrome P450 [Podospora appendiculata]|uniref:Cytochrome P450 n=1 Tax=Podospora appendiculata TaxID=314037 RepID=A0AAE1CAP0_9PEZI|nr:cytochrome P450 [Podospora appendiculata]
MTIAATQHVLLAHPEELLKLKAELSKIEVDSTGIPALSQVEGLPYLNAVIQEALRVHPGVLTRQMRVSPEVPIVYVDKKMDKTYVVPPGSVTSMSPLITHRNPAAFEDPMSLARREMELTLATIVIKYDLYMGQEGPSMELYDTERARDVDAYSDYIIPVPEAGSQGVRIRFRH